MTQKNDSSVGYISGQPGNIHNGMDFDECLKERRWYVFLLSSILWFVAGVSSVLVFRIIHYLRHKIRHRRDRKSLDVIGNIAVKKEKASFLHEWMSESKDWAGELISGQSVTGRILLFMIFVLSIASLIVYLIEASHISYPEQCVTWVDNKTQQVDLAINIIFMIYFFLRYLAAADKFWFWLDLYTLVDCCTIPPSFVTIYMERKWLGLRFTRALRIMNLPDVLQYLNILNGSTAIRLCQLITKFAGLVMTAAGFIHLVENSGDPPDFIPVKPLTYFQCVYFMIVTVSTVGYGDVTCQTTMGRVFMIIFILGGLAVFANAIPEIADIFASRIKYGGEFKNETGKTHIVLCGFITYESVSNFLADFLHSDRNNSGIQIVVIHNRSPSLQFQNLLKRHCTKLTFFQGTVISQKDLQRIKLAAADACLVLANKFPNDPESEDSANIMRVIAVKNFCSSIKVIVQLIDYDSKNNLETVPGWNYCRGDDVVCLSELKMGFIAQSCQAPGFSTLLANLFAMRSYKDNMSMSEWQNLYLRGAGMEIYSEYFSPSFYGKTFASVAEKCYTKLELLLIGITKEEHGHEVVVLNPHADAFINESSHGFFVAQSEEEVKKVFDYCEQCHHSLSNIDAIRRCSCASEYPEIRPRLGFRRRTRNSAHMQASSDQIDRVAINANNSGEISNPKGKSSDISNHFFEQLTGRYFEDARHDGSTTFSNHIVVCIMADPDSPLIGLHNFVSPLRQKALPANEVKPIIFLGHRDFIRREWQFLKHFQRIHHYHGNPKYHRHLRNVSIEYCSMCVILSSKRTGYNTEDLTLIDKDVILCSLIVKAEESGFREQNDNQLVKCNVPMITELVVDNNVQFLKQDDDTTVVENEFYMSQPFACGTAFAASLLDSLMSTAYYNTNALKLLRTLILSNTSLHDNGGNFGCIGNNTQDSLTTDECRIALLGFHDEPLCRLENVHTYRNLFCGLLRHYSVLCFGLYRQIPRGVGSRNGVSRYVIAHPPSDLVVLNNDKVYCLLNPRFQSRQRAAASSPDGRAARNGEIQYTNIRFADNCCETAAL